MNRRQLLIGILGITQIPSKEEQEKGAPWKVSMAAKQPGYCPSCGEKAKAWEPDKPCRYEQKLVMTDDNAFFYDPFPGRVINPTLQPCDKVDMFTGTRDWRRHICHNCKAMFAIPKGFTKSDTTK